MHMHIEVYLSKYTPIHIMHAYLHTLVHVLGSLAVRSLAHSMVCLVVGNLDLRR